MFVSSLPPDCPPLQRLVCEEGSSGVGNNAEEGRGETPVQFEDPLLLDDAGEDHDQVLVLFAVAVGDGHHGPGSVKRIRQHLTRGSSQASSYEPDIKENDYSSKLSFNFILTCKLLEFLVPRLSTISCTARMP